MAQSFDDMLDVLQSIPCLNYGGCGISAYAMLKWMEKYAPDLYEQAEVIYAYGHSEYDESYNRNTRYFDGDSAFLGAAGHIVLRIADCVFDSHDEREKALPPYYHILPMDCKKALLLKSINCGGGYWNTMFDRDDNVQRIAEGLDVTMGEVILELNRPTALMVMTRI